jgi:hypothetical protein
VAGMRPKGYRRPRYLAGLRYAVPGVRVRTFGWTGGWWVKTDDYVVVR